jgi:hypothetical protein
MTFSELSPSKMEPETQKLIDEWPELSQEEAKLMFIRKSAQEAFSENKIKEATADMLKTVVKEATIASMSKEEIGQHIGNLERVRSYLAAFTQGLSKAYTDEEEPKIRAKRKAREAKDKASSKSKSSKPKASAMFAALMAAEDDIDVSSEVRDPASAGAKVVDKKECPNCKAKVFSLKFHKCKN